MKNSLVLLLAFTSTYLSLSAQDCIPWSHYRTVTIDNSSGAALSDYQIRIPLHTQELVDAGKLRFDGADIRVFANDCTPLPFWGDSLGTSTLTDIWVKIPSIPAGLSSSIQIYYGHPTAASIADGENTFIFFDDFSADTINPAKWETIGAFASFYIEDGLLHYSSTSENPGARFKFARTVPSFSEEVIFDYNGVRSNSNGFGFSSADEDLKRILFRSAAFGFDTLNQVAFMQDSLNNGVQVEGFYPLLPFARSAFNTASITAKINANNNLELNRFANVGLNVENTDTYELTNVEMSGFHFILSTFGPGPTIQLDNIRVRQSAANPPSISLGEELVPSPSAVSSLIDPALVKVFPNPAAQYSWVEVDLEEPVRLDFRDAIGRTIPLESVILAPGQSHRLDVRALAGGMYYLQFYRLADGVLLHSRGLRVQR